MTEEASEPSKDQDGQVEMMDTSSKNQEIDKEKLVLEPAENQESQGDQSTSDMEIEHHTLSAKKGRGENKSKDGKGSDGADVNTVIPAETIKNSAMFCK